MQLKGQRGGVSDVMVLLWELQVAVLVPCRSQI